VIPFPFAANTEEPILEDVGYLTDVIEAWSGAEQRIQLRAIPRRAIEYEALHEPGFAPQYANALLYGRGAETLGVPLWMYAERLTAGVSGGATALPVLVTDIPWGTGDLVLIWASPSSWEVVTFTSTGVNQVNCSATASAWPSGTIVVPMRVARIPAEGTFSWLNRDLGSSRVRFAIDAVGIPAPPGTAVGSGYLGLEVLDITVRNARESLQETADWKVVLLDSQTGAIQSVAQALVPKPVCTILWTAETRAKAKLMADFLDARRGRAIPFWLPTYRSDLVLSSDLASGGLTATLRWIGYREQMFLKGVGRRHVALHRQGFPLEFARITGSAHTVGAATETITFSTGVSRDYPAATTTIMFLKYARLESDEVRRTWFNRQVVETQLAVRELPGEEPL
jgi:hypothetical protein